MTAEPASSPAPAPWRQPALLLAAALWTLRAVYAPLVNLFPEEAYYWTYAKHLDYGYLDHPPVVAWLIAAGTAVFGDTEFGVRVGALLCSLVTSFFVYRLAALLYDRRVAAVAVLVVQTLPFFFLSGIVMTPDAPLTAAWSAMLFFLASAIFQASARAWLGVGVALGLGMLSKYTLALLGPATLLFLALDPASRRWFRHPAPYLAVALSVVLFSPVIAWNAAHQWASFAFQTTGRTRVRRHFALHELAGSVLAVLTPVGIWLAALALGASPDPLLRRRRLFARVFVGVPLAVFVVFSLTHRVKLNWTGPLWLAVVPGVAALLANALDRHSAQPAALRLCRAWIVTVAACALAYGLVLHHLAFGLSGVRYSRNIEILPVGWPDLGRDLEARKADLERTSPAPVYIVGMDRNFIASEATFYQSDRPRALRETTGAHLFQGGSLMYRYWFPPEKVVGATLLLVSFQETELTSRRVLDHCRTADPVQIHTLEHRGRFVRRYYTRVAYDYGHPASGAGL